MYSIRNDLSVILIEVKWIVVSWNNNKLISNTAIVSVSTKQTLHIREIFVTIVFDVKNLSIQYFEVNIAFMIFFVM